MSVDPANGCSIAQLCPCSGPRGMTVVWRNHGQFVSCTAHAAEGFLALALIDQSQKEAVVSEAVTSYCGTDR